LFAREFPGGVNWRQAAGRLGFHRFRPGNAAKWIGIGIVAYIAFAIIYVSIFGEPKQDDIAGDFGPVWSQILLIVILAPLSEEICFRGMLFGGFRTRFNLPVAAIGAGLVFGALHFSTGPSAVPQLMVLGAIFAVVYDRTESIWPPIIFHAINNAYVLIVLNS
ncbi:MAG TPA: CPBP family intramembrane metalloprotease, partial [Solirubrobacterales bacterium]|nr:CPBP family intramembrane metalloprotease [Solirubrobacterales bacterium]